MNCLNNQPQLYPHTLFLSAIDSDEPSSLQTTKLSVYPSLTTYASSSSSSVSSRTTLHPQIGKWTVCMPTHSCIPSPRFLSFIDPAESTSIGKWTVCMPTHSCIPLLQFLSFIDPAELTPTHGQTATSSKITVPGTTSLSSNANSRKLAIQVSFFTDFLSHQNQTPTIDKPYTQFPNTSCRRH